MIGMTMAKLVTEPALGAELRARPAPKAAPTRARMITKGATIARQTMPSSAKTTRAPPQKMQATMLDIRAWVSPR